MTSCISPIIHVFCFLLALLSAKRRKAAWKSLCRLIKPLTHDQKVKLGKAKREAQRVFQPRRIAVGAGIHRLAEHGECGGSRYSMSSTSLKDLAEFGLGVSGYFAHLQGLIFLCFLMTAINIPTMYFFDTDEYRQPGSPSFPFFLRGSGVCTATEEVSVLYSDGNFHTHMRNLCPFSPELGFLSLATVSIAAWFVLFFRKRMEMVMVSLDTSQQTAQDYSVLVHDPDPDATDPDEWKAYFSQFGEVASVTVALSNGALLRAMAERRFIKLMVQYETPDGACVDTHIGGKMAAKRDQASSIASRQMLGLKAGKGDGPKWMATELNTVNASKVLNLAGFGLTQEQWMVQYQSNQSVLETLYQQHFPVSKVFCAFESEQGQRSCLQKLTIGLLPSLFDWRWAPPESRFRGTNELLVREACEPRDVIWENLGKNTWYQRFTQRVICLSYLCLLNFIFALAVWAVKVATGSILLTSCVIAFIDEYAPVVIRQTVDSIEVHVEASHRQWSLMNQMYLFLAFNAALVIYIMTPVEDTLSADNLTQVAEVIVLNSMITPVLRYLEPVTTLRRRVHAPYAPNYIKMKSFFAPEVVDLG
jgi:hypothetical protein